MKNLINWLIVALSFVCLQTVNGQIDPSLLSMKNRQIGTASQPVTVQSPPSVQQPETPKSYQQATKSIERFKTQHMVTSGDIQADTSGQVKKPDFIDKINTAAINGWESAFKSGKRSYKDSIEFHIEVDMIYRKRVQDSLAEELNRRAAEFPLQKTNYAEPVPAPTFQKSEITVRFENGQIVPINQLSDAQKKAIVDTLQKPKVLTITQIFDKLDDSDELIDSIFTKSPEIVFRGEKFQKVLTKEVESETYKAARAKRKTAPKQIISEKEIVRTREQFIAKYSNDIRKCELDGIPFAIKMAQALVEGSTRDGGLSKMAREGNNTFGIKCKGGQCHEVGCNHGYYNDDRERETFMHFTSISECIKFHTKFLQKNDRYNNCFECGLNDIPCWAWRLQIDGYATHPHYFELLISTINVYDLTDEPITETRKQVKSRLAKRLK